MNDNDEKYARALKRIIDRYSATPVSDPEIVNYASRPSREAVKQIQIERVSWGASRYKGVRASGKTRKA